MSKGCGAAHGWVNIYRDSAEHIANLKREEEEYRTMWPDFVTDRAASHQSLEHTSRLIEALTAASWIAYVIDGRMDMGSVAKLQQHHPRIDTSKQAAEQLVRQLHAIQTLLMEREQKRSNDGVQTVVAMVECDEEEEDLGDILQKHHHQQHCKVARSPDEEYEDNDEIVSMEEESGSSSCIMS